MRALRAAVLAVVAPVAMGFSDIHPGDVTKTNATLVGHVGAPAEAARLSGYRFARSSLAAPFGAIATVLAESDPHKPLIVACGGNSFREPERGAAALESLAPFGDVLLFDYPGLGRSGGTGAKNEYLAAVPVLSKAVAEIASRRTGGVIFWGHSLGGGFCAALAAAMKIPSRLVMEGAFANLDDIAEGKAGVMGALVHLTVDPATLQLDVPALLADYHAPIVVVASKDDETIPFSTTRHLAERLSKAGKPVRFIALQGSDHGALRGNPLYAAKMREALDLPPTAAAPVPPETGCSPRFVADGCGTLVWPDGTTLTGSFKGGKYQGPIAVTYDDGARFEGNFIAGDAHGTARFTGPDGMVVEGVYVDGELDRERTPKEALSNFPFWRPLTASEAPIVIYAVVDEKGDADNLTIAVPASFTSDDADALDARVGALIAKWKFHPATIAGHPVRVPAVFTLRFEAGK